MGTYNTPDTTVRDRMTIDQVGLEIILTLGPTLIFGFGDN